MRRLALLAVIVVACGRPAPVTSPAPLTQLAYVSQIHHLSCEAAGLQMVLSHAGIERTQDQLLEQMGVDRQPPELGPDGAVLHWGDPYERFVGAPDGWGIGLPGHGGYVPGVWRAAQAVAPRGL